MPLFGNGKDHGPVQEPGKQDEQHGSRGKHTVDTNPAGWHGGPAGNRDPNRRGLGNEAGYENQR